jgi:acetylornithine deacetylase/succinyl-diaminopimelate desuccinylase-like protein
VDIQEKEQKQFFLQKHYAKISSRLVPNQNNEKIAKMFKEHFEKIAPDYVKVNVEFLHGGQAYVCPIDLPAYTKQQKGLMIETYNRKLRFLFEVEVVFLSFLSLKKFLELSQF